MDRYSILALGMSKTSFDQVPSQRPLWPSTYRSNFVILTMLRGRQCSLGHYQAAWLVGTNIRKMRIRNKMKAKDKAPTASAGIAYVQDDEAKGLAEAAVKPSSTLQILSPKVSI